MHLLKILPKISHGGLINSHFHLHDIQAFSDASSGFGIAITIGDRWRAWRLIPGWQSLDGKRDIGWAEALGFELLIRSIIGFGYVSGHFKVYGDNKGVVGTSEAKIRPQIESSAESTPSLNHITSLSPFTQHTSPVSATQQILLPEVSTLHPVSCFPNSNYRLISADSLLTRPSLSPPLKSTFSERITTPHPRQTH